ncbi:MAG TPA: UTP--glucose-1-phosphate uridylyltransferase [Polyangiaceae bacterium]|nr:UTP--glucose-1-phosphate uridylyltransferase [Polyangiaceae bacterium]
MALPLTEQLRKLPAAARETLARYHFDEPRFLELAARLRDGADDDGVVHGRIEPPYSGDITQLPDPGSEQSARLKQAGDAEFAAGRCALVVLAGGMATRMGGVVKALVEALPGKSFLDLRLAEVDAFAERYGAAPPLWLMTSDATDEKTREALAGRLDGERVAAFTQFLSLRLTPQGDIFLDQDGQPNLHAPGHGDLPDALRKSGLLDRFIARGGRSLMLTNLDNLGGTLDPAILGFHLQHGKPLTSEAVDKLENDRGGIPVRVDGKLRVLEEFRIPPTFDPRSVRVFNTNVFHVDARALRDLDMDWRYYTVKKKVGSKEVVQFERILNEISSELATQYLHMPRVGPHARFLPVKDAPELEQRRPEIELVARARGFLQ